MLDPEKATVELYNLSEDIGEGNNVAEQHPEIVQEMQQILNGARVPSELFSFAPVAN